MSSSRKPFLFIDGEGGNREDGGHDYIVLCGYSDYTGPLILENPDRSPLSTRAIIDWLLNLAARLKAEDSPHTIVGFGLGYDIAMWLHDIPERPAERLFRPELVGWVDQKGTPRWSPVGPYAMRQIGTEFQIIESTYGRGARKTKENRRSITVWDCWKFFQGSFVSALQKWQILTDDELERIETMKKKRSTFRSDEIDDEIIEYCLAECEAGVKLMTKLDATCVELGYPLRRYDGAGSLAAAMLRKWSIDAFQAPVPEKMRQAVACAYFGGRFEVAAHGLTDKEVWQYDINSAYPTIIKDLPCLAHAQWIANKEVVSEGIYEVVWEAPNPCHWGPLPHRNRKGEITYPQSGHGWYWGSELLAAEQLYPSSFQVLKGWSLKRGCHHVPFKDVPSVYVQRQNLGASAAGIVLKLGLNSLYGKTAQSIGQPKYANYIWAGMITAGCRAMILDAIRIAGPEHILMTATDSVLSDCPIDLPTSPEKKLGEWDEATAKGGILIIQPGITIAYDDTGNGTYKSRGLGKHEFARHADAAERAWATLGILGSFTAQSHRFIGMKTALARGKYDTRCRWVDVEQKLKFLPGSKRLIPNSEMLAHYHHRQLRSLARPGWPDPSLPYKQIYARLLFGTEFDEAVEIGEQPGMECEWLEVTTDG